MLANRAVPGSGWGAGGGLWGLFCWKRKLINVLQTENGKMSSDYATPPQTPSESLLPFLHVGACSGSSARPNTINNLCFGSNNSSNWVFTDTATEGDSAKTASCWTSFQAFANEVKTNRTGCGNVPPSESGRDGNLVMVLEDGRGSSPDWWFLKRAAQAARRAA